MLYETLKNDPTVAALLEKGNADLGVLGYTDHSMAHCVLVAERAAYILRKLDYSEREQELARIAGLLHDIGNAVNRVHHAEYGALLANDLLQKTELPLTDRVIVISAIGNHDESTGGAKDAVSGAGGQDRRAAQPRPPKGKGEIRHPRPRELRRHRLKPQGGRGGAQDRTEFADRRQHLHDVRIF